MGKNNKPTDEQLRELYQAAADFKKAQPWNWLYDADIICVENPDDKSMGYCSVMGRAGVHFALAVYLGDEGIYNFCQLMENRDSIPDHQVLHYHNCLMCSFEDRDQLSNEDRKELKTLGLSFRGRNAWPMFRRYEPGYAPWPVNQEECIFLTHALRQTLIAAMSVAEGKLHMDMENGETVLRYSRMEEDGLKWYSKEIRMAYPTVTYSPVEINNDVLIHRIKKAGSMGNVSMLVDTCYMPAPVQENKEVRPYFPRLFILVDQEAGLVMDFEMFNNIKEEASVVIDRITDVFLNNGTPSEIRVRSDSLAAILKDLCKKTGIKLKKVKKLPLIDNIIEEMVDHFRF